jgi:hypothetical protein
MMTAAEAGMSANFDTLKMMQRLELDGFTREQAEALTRVVHALLDDGARPPRTHAPGKDDVAAGRPGRLYQTAGGNPDRRAA